MGRQYYGTYLDMVGTEWTVELHDNNAANNYELKIGVDPIISYQGEGSNLFPCQIMSSRAEVIFTMRDSNDYGNFVNISLQPEQGWIMKIKKAGVQYWVGMVLTDQFDFLREARDTGYAQIKVTAVDGLERLSGFKVLPGWFTSGRATFAYVTVQILAMCGLSDEWGSSDDYIRWAGQTENANTNASYATFDAKIRDLSFVKNKDIFKDSSKIEWMNCKEALEQILTAFGARIMHCNGVYWITQANAYNDSDWTYDAYTNSGVINGAYGQSYTHRVTVNSNTTKPVFEAYPNQRYQPPARAVLAKFDRVNGEIASKTTQNTTAITCTHNDIVATASPAGRAVKIDIDIDFSYYTSYVTKYEVHKTYYADNGSGGTKYQPRNGVWTAVSGSLVADVETYYDGLRQRTFMNKKFKHSVELVAPPTGQTNIVCEVVVKRITNYAATAYTSQSILWTGTLSTVAHEFTGSITIMQAFNTNTTPWEYIQANEFESDMDSPRDVNSESIELNCGYYNGKKYDIGSVLVKSGASTWIEAGNWTAPWTALAGDLPALLANQFAGIYSDYTPTTRGTLHDAGSTHAVSSLYFDSTIWIFNGGTFNMWNCTFDGEWVGVTIVYTNVNNNGEGERIQKQDEVGEREIDILKAEVDHVRSTVGNLPLSLLPVEIINNATGAPTSDPGADKYYAVKLFYDYDATNPTLQWALTEVNQDAYGVLSITHTDSPYTLSKTTGEWLLKCDTTGGNITVNLPTAVGNKAKFHIIKTAAANAVTIDGNASETINGSTTHGHGSQWETITIISDNSNWIIIN